MKKHLLCLIPLILLTGCRTNKKIDLEFIDNHKINYGEKINTCGFVKSVNGKELTAENFVEDKIVSGNIQINCSEIDSSKIGKAQVIYNFGQQIFTFDYEVVDNEMPTISVTDDIYIDVDQEFDINDYIQVEDNQKIEGFYVSNIDTSKSGIYEVVIKAKDPSNNESQKNIFVHVGNNETRHPISDQSQSEQEIIAAQRLEENMKKLEESRLEQEKEEASKVTEEDIIKKEEEQILDPNCMYGLLEIEAENPMEALKIALNENSCWYAEVLLDETVEIIEESEKQEEPEEKEESEEKEKSEEADKKPTRKIFKLYCSCTKARTEQIDRVNS